MAVKQGGGPGTKITVYDSGHADAGGDGAYGIEDVRLAMNVLNPGQGDLELMGGLVSGNNFGTRKQYMLNVNLDWGGDAADGNALTVWKDTNVDIFVRSPAAMAYRIGAGPIETRLGVKLGTGPVGNSPATMCGYNGVNIFGTSMVFRNDLYVYGCRLLFITTMSFLSTGASFQEVAGNLCTFQSITSVLGDSTGVGDFYNNLFMSTNGTSVWSGSIHHDEDGNIIGNPGSLQAYSLGAGITAIRSKRVTIVGSFSRDFQINAADAGDYKIMEPIFATGSGAGIVNYGSDHTVDKALSVWRYFNTKVTYGATPLANIPVRLESDVDGPIIDTLTFSDGDVGFIQGTSGYQNGVRVAEKYRAGGVNLTRYRTFTLHVNSAGGTSPPNPAYPESVQSFRWPGETSGVLGNVWMPVDLAAVPPPAPVQAITVDQVPAEAFGVTRILTTIK